MVVVIFCSIKKSELIEIIGNACYLKKIINDPKMVQKWKTIHVFKRKLSENANLSSKMTFEPFQMPIMGANHEI